MTKFKKTILIVISVLIILSILGVIANKYILENYTIKSSAQHKTDIMDANQKYAEVNITPSTREVHMGDTIRITVAAKSITGLGGFDSILTWNEQKIQFTNKSSFPFSGINELTGEYNFSVLYDGDANEADLAVLEFKILDTAVVGETLNISFSDIEIIDNDYDGIEIEDKTIALSVTDHNFTNYTSNNDATCTEDGTKTGKCAKCGQTTTITDVGSAKGHTEVTVAGVQPTCTEAGMTEGKYCSVCNKTLIEQQSIEAKGHTEVVDARVEPTCTKTGLTEGKHCSVCNAILVKQEIIKAKGHTEVVDAKVEPTCTKTGLTEGKHCSVCNTILVKQEIIKAKGHIEVVDAKVEPTCTKTGLTEGKHCSVCNTILVKQEIIKAKGHHYENWKCTDCNLEAKKITVESDTYEISEQYITKIEPKTTLKAFLEKLDIEHATEIKVLDKNGNVLTENDLMGTAATLILESEAGTKRVKVVIAGDVTGDGNADFKDIVALNRHKLKKNILKDEYLLAGDVTGDGLVDFKDIVKVNRFKLNKITTLF